MFKMHLLNMKLVFLNGKHFVLLKPCVSFLSKKKPILDLNFISVIEMFYQRKIFFSLGSSARLSGK